MIIGDNLIYEKLYLRYLRYLLSTTIAGVQRTVPGTCAHAHAHERTHTTSQKRILQTAICIQKQNGFVHPFADGN